MNFISHINGVWKIKRKIFPNTMACGYAKISTNKNLEIILSEKFLTTYKHSSIFGNNEYLIKIIKNKIVFFFNTGPNNGRLFQKTHFPREARQPKLSCTASTDTYWTTSTTLDRWAVCQPMTMMPPQLMHKFTTPKECLFPVTHSFVPKEWPREGIR